MLHSNGAIIHPPGLLLFSNNIDWGAGKTSGYTGRDKNAEPCLILSSGGTSGLVIVTYWDQLDENLYK